MNDLQFLLGEHQAGGYTTEDWHNNFDDNIKVDRILRLAQRQVLPSNYYVKHIYKVKTDLEYFQIGVIIGFANGEFQDRSYVMSVPTDTNPRDIPILLEGNIALCKADYKYKLDNGILTK